MVPGSGVLYTLMHKKGYDGSHTENANEVWAIDLKRGAVLSRSTVRPLTAITVSGGTTPVLYGYSNDEKDKGVVSYAINTAAAYAVREDSFLKLNDAGPRLEVR